MVLDLFAGTNEAPSGGRGRRSTRHESSVSVSRGHHARTTSSARRRSRNGSVTNAVATVASNTEEERQLFTNCVSQVQRNLKAHAGSPSTLHTLASYYTRTEPRIEGRPFCVSLSYATFLFHMQMARISISDVELYVQLIANVLSQLTEDQQMRHPFVQQVLRDHVFGLPSPTCRGAAHCVVLVPPQQYRAFATMATALLALDIVPMDLLYQFQDKLEFYCSASSPIVANRALALLVQTVSEVRIDEQVTALQYVLRTKPVKMNVDFLLACYERLKRAVLDAAHGPTFGRALAIHCSELFLRFRSPIRREYVERFLYPSLCHPDMAGFLQIPATREHLLKELLHLCTPGMGTSSPYYMCLCAMMQTCFDDEIDGALETVTLINCQMPHAAYFMSALAIDSHMSVSMFAKVVIALSRGAGFAMTGRDVSDEVANSISRSRTSVYNVLFMLREVVRSCSITNSRRATDMLKALRVAVPIKSIEALGKLSSEAFDGRCDITVDPQLLCAELAMVLHHEHIEAAAESAVEYFRDVTTQCQFCGMQRSTSLLCAVNGTVHVTGQTSVSRVLSTLAECAGAKVLEERMIRYLRDPATQMDSAVHFLFYHILANAGQHRNSFFVQLEPYIRSTLMALVSADRSTGRGLVTSEHKANVLMLHVRTVALLASAVDPSYLESILKVFAELKVRNNHDALALWLMGNLLIRNCKGNIELLPTDPQENNYAVDYPGCAPASATCADNAQLVLRLLDRAHSFSAEMRKLVGCCVCKLVQDFNVQAPNIIMTLLSSFGFVPTGLPSLAEFALPVGAGSTFWNFFLQQMKTSAPARTAFMAALAKSMSRRFRIATPADAIAPYGVEATGHLFTVMMYEAMKRNPPLARVVLFMVSHWMKQTDHVPGKFVCLVYVCAQLITAVVERGEGEAQVEMEAETAQDRHQFDESSKKAARILKSQQTRLEKLIPAVRRDSNTAFFHLIRRLQRKVRRTVGLANGDIVPGTVDPDEEATDADADDYDAMGVNESFAGNAADNEVFQVATENRQQQHQQQPYSSTIMALRELQNTADDSVFDHENGGYDNAFDADGEEYDTVGMEGTDTTNYGSSGPTTGPAPHRMHLSNVSANASNVQQSSRTQQSHSHHNASFNEISGILKKHGDGARRHTAAYHEAVDPFDVDGAPSEVLPVSGDVSSEYPQSDRGHYHQQHHDRYAGEGGVYKRSDLHHASDRHTQAYRSQGHPTAGHSPRSQSRGVQTDNDEEEEEHQTYNAASEAGRSNNLASPAVGRQRQYESDRTVARGQQQAHLGKRSHDKGVTAPFERSIGTSPIHQDDEANRTSSGSPRVTSGRYSTWQEPDLEAYVQGDATPIDETGVPHLQATTALDSGGATLPSGMVLEYLRTHQAMDSLRHELNQLDQGAVLEQVAQYVQQHNIPTNPPPLQTQTVTVEGRANNYSAPHTAPRVMPGRTVTAPVTMVSTTPTAHVMPQPAQEQPRVADVEANEEADVVDGEQPVRAVSETALSKRRRTEQQQQQQQQAAGVPAAVPMATPDMRGINFFLYQQQLSSGGGGASALQDLRFMQRQHGAMEALAAGQSAPEDAERDENASPATATRGTAGPVGAFATEGLPPTTPYGQVVIPACFVEQKNDTAIRELRQAMGTHNPNDVRLSTHGKTRIRGSGGGAAASPAGPVGSNHGHPQTPRAQGSSGHKSESRASNVWWSEMSTVPMPGYTNDPQYSMELF